MGDFSFHETTLKVHAARIFIRRAAKRADVSFERAFFRHNGVCLIMAFTFDDGNNASLKIAPKETFNVKAFAFHEVVIRFTNVHN